MDVLSFATCLLSAAVLPVEIDEPLHNPHKGCSQPYSKLNQYYPIHFSMTWAHGRCPLHMGLTFIGQKAKILEKLNVSIVNLE